MARTGEREAKSNYIYLNILYNFNLCVFVLGGARFRPLFGLQKLPLLRRP